MAYSVVDIKTHFSKILREVEAGKVAEVQRHGESVAVLVSVKEYNALLTTRPSFSAALETFRSEADFVPIDLNTDELRDKTTGRDVEL